eukprot:3000423-Lingulodinium_polyedra.AAC.1
MGGIASTVLWNIGYDPIVHAAQGPTYIDDLVGLTIGVVQTFRLHFFLLVAGHNAGLRIATHSCATVCARSVHLAVDSALSRFP